MYEKMDGLNVVGINTMDSLGVVDSFRKEFKLSMPLVFGGQGEDSVSRKYGVYLHPTNYILDKDGKIVAAIISNEMDLIKSELAKLGISEK
ncbi:MAG: TlpA family protein disulfide reductase [Armatimonadetes bacterium]|nr:TlpA family protein disulfide reductase [Armatimonadota bacterium]